MRLSPLELWWVPKKAHHCEWVSEDSTIAYDNGRQELTFLLASRLSVFARVRLGCQLLHSGVLAQNNARWLQGKLLILC